jgi:deazaflavin-dependent oxidoreductase (nitroreductase family)
LSEPDGAPRPQRPQIPTDMKTFNRAVIEEHRANGGRLSGPMAGRGVLLLTTTGARSGEPRTVVIGYGRRGAELIAIASNNGAPAHPSWYRNLAVNPTAMVEVGPEAFEVRVRTARPDEREELAKIVPYLESQQKLTPREIPIVVLERIETS